IGQVDDQGIVRGPALGGINATHRLVLGRIGAQAIDGLGRKRAEAAGAQERPGRLDGRRIGWNGLGQPVRRLRSKAVPTAIVSRILAISLGMNGRTPLAMAASGPTSTDSQATPRAKIARIDATTAAAMRARLWSDCTSR